MSICLLPLLEIKLGVLADTYKAYRSESFYGQQQGDKLNQPISRSMSLQQQLDEKQEKCIKTMHRVANCPSLPDLVGRAACFMAVAAVRRKANICFQLSWLAAALSVAKLVATPSPGAFSTALAALALTWRALSTLALALARRSFPAKAALAALAEALAALATLAALAWRALAALALAALARRPLPEIRGAAAAAAAATTRLWLLRARDVSTTRNASFT
eukprot:6158817-Pleurochrysis_carterae.AAC.5